MDSKKYSIYQITNPTGKIYIGQSCSVAKRIKSYKYCKPDQKAIHNSIKKYGYDSHKFEVRFSGLTKTEADIFEIEMIEYYKSLRISLNIANGGSSNINPYKQISVVRFTLSGDYIDEFDSITEAAKYVNTSSTCIRDALPREEGQKRKVFTAKGFLWLTKDEYEKGILPKLKPKAQPKKGKQVFQFDLDGNFLHTYISIRQASRLTGIDSKIIRSNCNKITKRSKQFIFSYDNTAEPYEKTYKRMPVYLYDIDGSFIKHFTNSDEATKELHLHKNTISRRLNDKNQLKGRLYNKFLLSYERKENYFE